MDIRTSSRWLFVLVVVAVAWGCGGDQDIRSLNVLVGGLSYVSLRLEPE